MSRASIMQAAGRALLLSWILIFGSGDAFAWNDSRAFVRSAMHDIASLSHAVEQWQRDKGILPTEEQGLELLVEQSYLGGMPRDPWGNQYIYVVSGEEFEIRSLGANGEIGGVGCDYDFNSRNDVINEKNYDECEPIFSTDRVIVFIGLSVLTLSLLAMFFLIHLMKKRLLLKKQRDQAF